MCLVNITSNIEFLDLIQTATHFPQQRPEPKTVTKKHPCSYTMSAASTCMKYKYTVSDK